MYIPPPLPPPSVGPSVRVATARSGFFSLVTYYMYGGTQVAHPTGGGPWTYSLPNDIYKIKEKRKYGSLCLDAHEFRTPLVLRYMVLLHSTHTTNLHYTTLQLVLTTDLLRRKRSVCFKSRMFVFSCSAVLLPETYVPYLPSNLFKSSSSTYHAMPPCKEEGRRPPSSPAGSYIPY